MQLDCDSSPEADFTGCNWDASAESRLTYMQRMHDRQHHHRYNKAPILQDNGHANVEVGHIRSGERKMVITKGDHEANFKGIQN